MDPTVREAPEGPGVSGPLLMGEVAAHGPGQHRHCGLCRTHLLLLGVWSFGGVLRSRALSL